MISFRSCSIKCKICELPFITTVFAIIENLEYFENLRFFRFSKISRFSTFFWSQSVPTVPRVQNIKKCGWCRGCPTVKKRRVFFILPFCGAGLTQSWGGRGGWSGCSADVGDLLVSEWSSDGVWWLPPARSLQADTMRELMVVEDALLESTFPQLLPAGASDGPPPLVL